MASLIKAMYPISLQNDGRTDQERNIVNKNQDRLNDNFRSLAAALVELWQSNDHSFDFLSARIDGESTELTALGELVAQHQATILVMPDTIINQVAQIITEYNDHGVQEDSPALTTAISSLMRQQADNITVLFTTEISGLSLDVAGQGERLSTLEDWFKVVARDTTAGTNAGAIIGSSDSDTSFKAEATCIYFYRGDVDKAKWANALAGMDANGNFVATDVHTDSILLNSMFDIDVVTADGVDFLHITGRS